VGKGREGKKRGGREEEGRGGEEGEGGREGGKRGETLHFLSVYSQKIIPPGGHF
jgi:hypothetical protein